MSAQPNILLSIIIPTYNEATNIEKYLTLLQPLRSNGVEVIMVDGGSGDATLLLAAPYVDKVITSDQGRANQMNVGVKNSTGAYLLFLHADTTLPAQADHLIVQALQSGYTWGRFDITLAGNTWMLKVIATCMNIRSRYSGIATGDQGVFITRGLFDKVGGFPLQPLMEDVEITSRLRRLSKPACLSAKVVSSGRRWEKYGTWRTICLMWRLRYRYWRGVDSRQLAKEYRSGY